MKKVITLILILSLALSVVFAEGAKEAASTPRYVASTSWVAAIAEIAGLDGVVTVAPADLRHPPEYEITPMDMVKVANAEIFMYGGYEAMMKTIAEAAEIKDECKVQVRTTNTLANLTAMVERISVKAGTEEEAAKRLARFTSLFEEAREKISSSSISSLRVWANSNQAEFARDLGLNVVATFGPGPLTSDEIAEASKGSYDLIIDNVHAPVASPASEVAPDSVVLVWRNFPQSLEKDALYNVISSNLDMLWSAYGIH
ncbi:MAG: ABC transporter substrate-binding protein [Candidatus Ornithospirochaeta sp.]